MSKKQMRKEKAREEEEKRNNFKAVAGEQSLKRAREEFQVSLRNKKKEDLFRAKRMAMTKKAVGAVPDGVTSTSKPADNEDMVNPDDDLVPKYTIDQVLAMKVENWDNFAEVLQGVAFEVRQRETDLIVKRFRYIGHVGH